MNKEITIFQEILENISDEYCCDLDCGCNDKEECLICTRDRILKIINKAKDINVLTEKECNNDKV